MFKPAVSAIGLNVVMIPHQPRAPPEFRIADLPNRAARRDARISYVRPV
jgi:hypothetical protein